MNDQLTVFDIDVTLTDAGVVVSGRGTPDGATVDVEVQINGGAFGTGSTTISNGSWSVTIPIAANPGDTGTANVKAKDGSFSGTATGICDFTL